MRISEFESLVLAAGLHLNSKYAPRFIVSLRVPKQFGTRYQCGRLDFSSVEAFSEATKDEVVQSLDILKKNLLRASRTQSGDIGNGMVVQVKTASVKSSVAIGYPVH